MQTEKLDELVQLAKEVAESCLQECGGRSTEFLLAQSLWHDARLLRVQIDRPRNDTDVE